MTDRSDLLRIDATGTVHAVGRVASQQMRQRAGDWRALNGPRDVLFLKSVKGDDDDTALRLAGEIRSPGALCDVVALATQSQWKGELVVVSEEGTRSFYFESGNVLGATTTVPEERLGETLYHFGVLTRDQLDAIVKSTETSGKRLGEAAIELEYVSAEELYPMMARQVEEVFYAALHVSDGTFYFFDKFDEKNLVRRHAINAGGLLMEGARRMDEMGFFREKIPNETYIPTPLATTKKVPEELEAVFAQCDGKRSIAEIGRRTGQLEFEVTRAVFQLINGGFLHVAAPRPEGPEAIVEVFNPALIEIHERCDAAGKGADMREGLARFATGSGVYDTLFMGAGPLANGSLKPDRVARNLAMLAGEEPDAWLVQQLQEYVGFALFQAESLVPREVEAQLVTNIGEMLKPIRQLEGSLSRSNSQRPRGDALKL